MLDKEMGGFISFTIYRCDIRGCVLAIMVDDDIMVLQPSDLGKAIIKVHGDIFPWP